MVLLILSFDLPVSEQFGAKKSLIAGTIGNLICTIVRYIAAFIPTDNYGRYIMTLVGQLFGALSQPFFMNLPATIAMKWFPSHQREIATSIAALINPLGMRGRTIAAIISRKLACVPCIFFFIIYFPFGQQVMLLDL